MFYLVLVFCFSLILLIPTYKIINKFFIVAGIGNNMSRGNITILITLILFPVIFRGNWGIGMMVNEYYQRQEFDQTIWLEKEQQRHHMTHHIIDSQMLIGKTKQEIVSILGKDFYTDCSFQFYDDSSDCMNYEIGFVERIFTSAPFLLKIIFNEGKASLVTHEYHAHFF